MRKLFLMAVAFIALAFASCKKDDPAPNPGTAAKLLKKITQTEAGATRIYNLFYDANKRLDSIKSTDGIELTKLIYDAAGNLISIDEKEEDFHNIYVYTYANGLPVSATFKSWELHNGQHGDLIEDDELTYTVDAGKVTGIRLDMSDGSWVNFALTYTNGNLTSVNSVGNDFYKASFIYGNKKSPFPQASKFVLDHAGFSLLLYAKNEIITTSYDFAGTMFDQTITAQYTYDAAGYPLTSDDGETLLQFEYQ